MADIQMGGRGFAPQAGSHHAYQAYQNAHPPQSNAPAQTVRAGVALTGALLSLALVVGVGVWGYKLMARDVAGVPVVRAVQGEMRVRPEDPGGSQADHQGFAVNEVAAAGGTAGPSEQIVLAPEPIDLSDESTPLIDQLAAAQPRYANSSSGVATQQPQALAQPQPEAELTPEMASIQALADKIAAGATPLSGIGQTTQPEAPDVPQALAAPKTQTAPATLALSEEAISPQTPGVSISLRPQTRPAALRTASLGSVATTSSAGSVTDVDPSTIPAGTRLVQLGAYESPEIARREWDRFATRFSDYMSGKDRVVQRAQSGGRTFYRLRVMGFSDLSDARRFCSALTAQNTDCIPVVTR